MTTRRSLFTRAGLAGLATAVLTTSVLGAGGMLLHASPAAAAETVTSSAVTLTNQKDALVPQGAPFPDLTVTISQTTDLVSQGIRVSWTGGEKSGRPDSSHGGENFLQIAQCWGEDPERPGHPDRRTCQYGGGRVAGSERDGLRTLSSTAPEDKKYTADLGAYAYTGIPFVATNPEGIVDEKRAPQDRVLDNFVTHSDGSVSRVPEDEMKNLSDNQFFTRLTTNEVKWAPAGNDGSGSVPFEVQTAMQSTALGCGTPRTLANDTVVGQSCWLVIIPRGTGDSGEVQNNRSGLWWDAWEHHLAVKLDFKPLGVRCQIGAAERQLAGSELISGAISSWQPQLCRGKNGAPFVLREGNEADATVRAAGVKPSPLAFTSRPVDMSRIGATSDPLAYAPVAISGLTVSFAIDRQPHPSHASDAYKERAGLPMTDLKLTPRLLAKLLTASYRDALPSGANKEHIGYKSFREPGPNARTLLQDEEFLEINDPEWAAQNIVAASVADMLLPSGRSDLAVQLWEYVLSDAEAKRWLDGEPDRWGMTVNPWYSTNPAKNPVGAGLALPMDSFPKADPSEKPDTTSEAFGSGAVNLVTWRPFLNTFSDGAHHVLRGDGKILGGWDALAVPAKYSQAAPERFGSQQVIGLTSTPAAQLYQTVTASLRNSAGHFVAPTQEGLSAAAAAMTPTAAQPAVLTYSPASDRAKAASTAYPLTTAVYAALNPKQSDAGLRAAYADLIRYAVRDGQVPGTDAGRLPPGYAPLPTSWVGQALSAAAVIESGGPATPPSPPGTAVPAPNSAAGGGSAAPSRAVNAPAAPAGAPSDAAAEPVATGAVAGSLAGPPTPDDPEPSITAAAVPAGAAAGLAAAGAVLGISRIRRRT